MNDIFMEPSAFSHRAQAKWDRPVVWKAERVEELQVRQSTSTLERSLHSKVTDRVHFHWKVNLLEPLDCAGTAVFAFHGVRPDARASVVTAATKQARGANVAEASNRGHFYVWAPKKGCQSSFAVSCS